MQIFKKLFETSSKKKREKKAALMLLVQMMVHWILVNCFPLKHAKVLVQGPLCDIVCACFKKKKKKSLNSCGSDVTNRTFSLTFAVPVTLSLSLQQFIAIHVFADSLS